MLRPQAALGSRCAVEQPLRPEHRGKVVASARKKLVKRHEKTSPLFARALAIALGLIGINLTHFLQEVLCVRSRYVRRPGPVTIPLLWPPRNRIGWLLNSLRHTKKLRENDAKASG